MVKPIRTFTVKPSLPPELERQRAVVYNLRWAWNHDAIELFRWDSDLWEHSSHNPALMLGSIDQGTLQAAASDEGFLAHLNRVSNDFDTYLKSESTWFRKHHGGRSNLLVAYFSAEFGVTDCLSIFAGGLGILAGDHLKSASDLGVPLVAVGLLYQQGYFRQYLNEAGLQQEEYRDNDFHNLPLTLELDGAGEPLIIEVQYPGRKVAAQIWRAQVGRVALYLLDTNIKQNSPPDQDMTDQLYGGDAEMRLKQEMMLGVGGCRALEALGVQPSVYHLNEGHSAFLALERIRRLMEANRLSFAEAREAASAGLIFTTHTPVPAGHDYFQSDLMERYFSEFAKGLGLSFRDFLALGRKDPGDDAEPFCMTALALRLAQSSNGVSRLHGQVTRKMWRSLWPCAPEEEIPIGHVTNGVHFQSWISQEMDELYDRYLGPRWREEPADQSLWARAGRISAEELWRTHERRRERLVAFARRRLRQQLERRGAPQSEVEAADETLDPDALTIGFGRRFATYKRANLLLRDPERLARILNDAGRPVQIVFAGQAHPRDDAGKELIKQIVALSRRPEFRRRLVFLEGYDMAVARSMTQGSDVWLSTPRRPLEASGTSGMKAAANGALNLSTLDGWWDEAWDCGLRVADLGFERNGLSTARRNYAFDQTATRNPQPAIGWTIGRGELYDDPEYQDQVEAEALYDLLEGDVIPTFYDRGEDKLPRRWIDRMKASIGNLCHYFNTHRMVREYTERFYLPAAERQGQLTADGMARARALAAWKERVRDQWSRVRIESVTAGSLDGVHVNSEIKARAEVLLGALTPDDVSVELYVGLVNADGKITGARAIPMSPAGDGGAGRYCFEVRSVACCRSGLHGFTVRALPRHPDLIAQSLPGLIVWA
ncbi:MAG TPA: alpha-glucan family phosphorylase [Blastocatellia bacterium]|nr:alpha-glucan family phosphorylase [Blastocatellia bacterium]